MEEGEPKISGGALQQLQMYRQMMSQRSSQAPSARQTTDVNNELSNPDQLPNSSQYRIQSAVSIEPYDEPVGQQQSLPQSQQNISNNANGAYVNEADASYNPYLHGPSKGEYIKQQNLERIPTAIEAPDLIKIEAIPTKVVYDFTKRSANLKLVEQGDFDNFEYEERCDSKLRPEDFKKLEIELKKKHKKRQKRE